MLLIYLKTKLSNLLMDLQPVPGHKSYCSHVAALTFLAIYSWRPPREASLHSVGSEITCGWKAPMPPVVPWAAWPVASVKDTGVHKAPPALGGAARPCGPKARGEA